MTYLTNLEKRVTNHGYKIKDVRARTAILELTTCRTKDEQCCTKNTEAMDRFIIIGITPDGDYPRDRTQQTEWAKYLNLFMYYLTF